MPADLALVELAIALLDRVIWTDVVNWPLLVHQGLDCSVTRSDYVPGPGETRAH